VEFFVRYPMCSAEQPAEILSNFANCWESCTTSLEVKRARESSRPSTKPRLSKQINALKQRLAHGEWVAGWIAEDHNRWYQLTRADKSEWYVYKSGTLQLDIATLRQEQLPKFPGIATVVQRRIEM
jgi:hypothetical protein